MNNNLDILNVNASKPSLNTKSEGAAVSSGDLSLFNETLANIQKESISALGENVSLVSENLPNMELPNKVSDDSLKTFTENLNNFSGIENSDLGQNLNDKNLELEQEAQLASLMMTMNAQVQPVAQQVPVPSAESAQAPQAQASPAMDVIPLQKGVQTVSDKVKVESASSAKPEQKLETSAPVAQAVVADPQAPVADQAKASLKQAMAQKSPKGKLSLEGLDLVKPEVFAGMVPELAKAPQMEANVMAPNAQADLSAAQQNVIPFAANSGMQEKSAESGFKPSKESMKDSGKPVDAMVDQGFMQIANKSKSPELKVVNAPATQISEADRQKSIDQVISHARTIVNKGGGEMKIKMNDQQMGAIDLRVGVQNGQVSIEIQTQNDHVKRMFEEGLSDIRNALEVHNLKIDTLKVNVADGQLDRHMNQQFNLSDRDFARQFMGNFRDERQGFRQQSMTDAFSKFQRASNNDQPSGLRPASWASRGSNGSGRLNVVA